VTGPRLTAAPRYLHPGAWWCWALCLSAAATRTTNPLVLLLLVAAAGYVVIARHPNRDLYGASGLRSVGFFVRLGLVALAARLVFDVAFGDSLPGRVLIRLPSMPLPHWLTGLRIGGPVTLQSLIEASYVGLQLATLLVLIGAANTLASPRRLLRTLPGALYELGVAVTVALSFAPSLVDGAVRIRRARRLRGLADRGLRSWVGVALPVMQDALERSIALAAAMDSRGFGRRGAQSPHRRHLVGAGLVVGLIAVCASAYGLLATAAPAVLGVPLLVGGAVVAGAAVMAGGHSTSRSRYRPDPWRWPEWLTVAAGLIALAGIVAAGRVRPGSLQPSIYPLATPTAAWPVFVAVAAAVQPAWLTPAPPLARVRRAETMPQLAVVGRGAR
jgi:energy-coupling factor transport system permease protein